ncbi:C1GLT-like protein [Mya arenaria]|uniref:C1GLT-like protein n=1 Tax=Mya arenaria TaxID=6604 RepID=A0ABY7F019_MYAAR|nr:C1GLT-like protein [Mya arenaria]
MRSYIISKEALRRIGAHGTEPSMCRQDSRYEDVEFGKCMQNLGDRENISDYAISFHYMLPANMNVMEYFVYHLRPYGIHSNIKIQTRKRVIEKLHVDYNKYLSNGRNAVSICYFNL